MNTKTNALQRDAERSSVEHDADRTTTESRPSGSRPVGPNEDHPVSHDRIFEILKNQRRRYVLQLLARSGTALTLSDLAEQIAAWENDTEARLVTSSQRKRVYVGLYQFHLPKMDESGAIDYDQPRGVIEEGPHLASFTHYLTDTRSSTSWWRLLARLADRISSGFRRVVSWG